MSANIIGYVTNLTGGLARLFCKRCKEETIHRGSACTRTGCGTTHVAYPVRSVYSRSIAARPMKKPGVLGRSYPLVLQGSRPPKVELK